MKAILSQFVIKKSINIVYWLVTAFFVLVLILVLLTTVRFENRFFMFIVESGSMEPAIQTGSIVVSIPEIEYKNNDIISFISPSSENEISTIITHRIYDSILLENETYFITKGDANNIEDAHPITLKNILGKVHYAIPYLGYLVKFAKSPIGFIFTILLPTIVIIIKELISLKNEMILLRNKRRLEKYSD